MREQRPLKRLAVKTTTLRKLSHQQLQSAVAGMMAMSGSCGGGQHGCCQTGAGQESCDIENQY